MGDLGMVSLCRYVRVTAETRSENGIGLDLDLSSNKISDRGAEVLAKTLEMHPTCLKTLDLSNNYVGNRGWKVLHPALRKSSVEDVRILQNPITTPPSQLVAPAGNASSCCITLDHATFKDGKYASQDLGKEVDWNPNRGMDTCRL